MKFSNKTFWYFDFANANPNDREWFEQNKAIYTDHVAKPFLHLLQKIYLKLGSHSALSKIEIQTKRISMPLYAKNKSEEKGLIKNFASVDLMEKKKSLFEWNPGIHIQFGAEKDDNFYGLGSYMVSGRQLSLIRNGLVRDADGFLSAVENKKFLKAWGGLHGDKYKRFPAHFSESEPCAQYLWHKQFYVGKTVGRRVVTSKSFFDDVVDDLGAALPLLLWLRKTVGTYKGMSKVSRGDGSL